MANAKDFFVPKQSKTTQQKVAESLGIPTSQVNPNVNSTNQTPSGISSTIRSSGGGSRSSGGSNGGVSQPSASQIQAERNKQLADEKAKREAFSKTGGLVIPSSFSTQKRKYNQNLNITTDQYGNIIGKGNYFSVSPMDIQTDSQAIKTATNAADQITKESANKITKNYTTQVNRLFGQKDIDVLETKNATYYGIGENIYLDETAFKQYSKDGTYPTNSKTFTKQDIQTGKTNTAAQTKRIADIQAEESQFQFLGSYFAGGGKEVANIAGGVATKVIGAVAKPIVQSTAQVIGNTADDIYKMLSPATQKVVSEVAKSSAAKATQKTATEATKFAAGQVASAGGYIASAQSPEYGRQTYAFLNPDKATKYKSVFDSPESKAAEAQYITNRTVAILGGKTKNEKGEISDVKSSLDPVSTYFYQSFPGAKVTIKDYQSKEELIKQYENVPEFKALSDTEKSEAADYKIGEINAAMTAYIGGQLGAEMISNFAAGKAKEQTRKLLPKGAGDLSKNIVSAVTTSAYGAFGESPAQTFGEANLNRREVTNEQLLMSVAVGGASSAFFDFVPNQLRSSANTLLKESTETVVKSAGKKGSKEAVKKTTELALKASDAGKNKLIATAVEWGGNILDLAEKPGDVGSDLLGFASGKVKTLVFSGGVGIATTQSTGSKQKVKLKGGSYNTSTGVYTDAQGNKMSLAFGNVPSDAKIFSSGGVISIGGNVNVADTTGTPPLPGDPVPPVPSKPDDEVPPEEQDKSQSNVPSNALSNVPSTTAVIVPNRFWLPGFMPIGFGSKTDARERTKIYDELSAAGRRFQQLSGLPFVQQAKVKRNKTVMINGKEFKIGKRVKK